MRSAPAFQLTTCPPGSSMKIPLSRTPCTSSRKSSDSSRCTASSWPLRRQLTPDDLLTCAFGDTPAFTERCDELQSPAVRPQPGTGGVVVGDLDQHPVPAAHDAHDRAAFPVADG